MAWTRPLRRLTGDPAERSSLGWFADVIVVLFVTPAALPYLHRQGQALTPWVVLIVLSSTLPLLVRRIWPLPVLGWICAISLVAWLGQPQLAPSLAILVALYTVAAQCPRRVALTAAVLLDLTGVALSIRTFGDDWWNAWILLTGMVVAATGLGLYAATRRAYLAELTERARRLEVERDQQGELAAAAERARIAREIHDIVAHHLTVIVALSDGMLAAQAASTGPGKVTDGLTAVSATGRQALTDTRRLLGVLRDDSGTASGTAGRQPLPDLAGIDGLVDTVRRAGLPISYEVHGARVEVAPGVQLTAYRIVQEALTNTLKHAGPGTTARVELSWEPGELRVNVRDDGGGAGTSVQSTGAGRGLTGMRERVEAFDGTLTAGPTQPRGWQVSAQLNLPQEAAT
jgi:signal transduction histidine kinase